VDPGFLGVVGSDVSLRLAQFFAVASRLNWRGGFGWSSQGIEGSSIMLKFGSCSSIGLQSTSQDADSKNLGLISNGAIFLDLRTPFRKVDIEIDDISLY
jgi:hypothetical protein